jgi:putative ABC transport system ATP-binding protein
MLESSSLTFAYPAGALFRFPDLKVEPNAPLAVLGPSGCGKTTLLHLLGGLLRPTDGLIRLHGEAMTALRGQALDRFRGRNIGLVFQRAHFVHALTVEENLLAAPFCAGLSPRKETAHALAKRLGLQQLLRQLPHRLSQGEQQRLGIARAVMNQPRLILADEPTSNLDDANAEAVMRLLTEEAGHQQAVLVVVTHDRRVENYTRQVLRLEQPVSGRPQATA